MEKVAFNKETIFTNKFDLISRKKIVNCYIWSINLYRVEIGHFGNYIRYTWGV